MSLVVAIRDKGRFVLGADKQSSTGFNKDHTSTKIWEVPRLKGAVMGGVGSARASQIIQNTPIADKNDIDAVGDINTEWIITSLIPCIVAALRNNGVKCDVPEDGSCVMMPNAFLFAYKENAWMIWNDLSVTEVEDYIAIGSGSDVANGALFATQERNPFDRIVTAIDAAAETTLYVDNGVDLLTTNTLKSDAKAIAGALGVDLGALKKALTAASEKPGEKANKKKSKKSKKAVKGRDEDEQDGE